VVDAGGF